MSRRIATKTDFKHTTSVRLFDRTTRSPHACRASVVVWTDGFRQVVDMQVWTPTNTAPMGEWVPVLETHVSESVRKRMEREVLSLGPEFAL